jgi:4-amino-4-deoxy-L-arabinose transferase-like glycosyltransferase
MHKDPPVQRPGFPGILAIVGIAAILRLAWVLIVPIAPISDPSAYANLARTLLAHGVYGFEPDQPIAIWPPGTAAVYAAIFALPGSDFGAAKIFNLSVSLLNVVLVWLVGRQLFDDLTGRVAALAMAVWPQMIFFTTLLASEPMFIAMVLLAVLCWERGRQLRIGWILAAGLLFGLACYLRSVVLLLPIALTMGSLVAGGMARWQALVRLALVLGAMAAVIAPWTMRNQEVFGERIVMSSNFGQTLYMGNGPGSTGRHGSAEMPPEVREMIEGLSQPARSSLLADLAKDEILADPGAFVLRSLDKLRIIHDRETIGVAWNRAGLERLGVAEPVHTLLKVVATGFWWIVLACGVAGVAWQLVSGTGWRFIGAPALIVWLYFAALHAVVMASDRFHMPQAPFIAMIGASLVVGWLGQRRRATGGVPDTTPRA